MNLNETEQDELTKCIGYFEEFEEQSRDNRALCERDRDYADHKQWTYAQKVELAKRKQPTVINNRIRKKINFLRGLERQGRTDPKAYARTPKHEQDANSCTDALRFIADNTRFDYKRSLFFENYLVEGTGGAEITLNEKREIGIEPVEWDRLFWDYRSRDLDFEDARYKGIIIWMDSDDAEAMYPDAKEVIEHSFSSAMDDTYEDKPVNWVDSKRKRVRIAQIYYKKKGVWHVAHYTKAGFLIKPKPCDFIDEDKKPYCPLIMRSAYIDRDGNRFGEPRFMIEQQDSINKRESKMVHLISQRQTYGTKGAFENPAKAKRELAKADGHIELNPNVEQGKHWGILQTGDMALGQFQLLQEAKREMDETSVNASLTGAVGAEQSGRAIIAKQSGGQVEITPLMDGKREWETRVYRAFWNCVRQFWTDERWIRVTDDESNIRYVALNKRKTVAEAIQERAGAIPPQFANDPRLEMPVQPEVISENNVSELDVDIIVQDSPDAVNLQYEEFQMLVNLYQANPNAIPFDMIVEASQLRNKQKILEKLRGGTDEEKQMIAAKQQEKEQMQKMGFAAELQKTKAETFDKTMSGKKKQAEALETMRDIQFPALG